MAELQLFEDIVAEVAARLDLREPNRAAIETLAAEISQHHDLDGKPPPLEAVIDSATGIGKTYIVAGAMEFLASAYDVRDFVIVTPGRTILQKTKDNFTPGHPKSLLGPMSFRPTVITALNFATAATRSAMDDDTQVKIHIFTVQALTKPETKTGRRTRKFQEGLGSEFYAHLKSLGRLTVFADEHHTYFGPAFSKAVRELDPWLLLGLTATPAKKTPEEQIIFRYPIAAAIADKLVKTPVIVGRRDDRRDPLTKLTDGVTLLNAKAEAVKSYTNAHDLPLINPVMLVVAKTTDDADEYGRILQSSEFFGGSYADSVLVVHSKAPDEALAALAEVEEPDSPVRIIISVGMLKEGWDVKNVYVIASVRASVSEILTEQTLGRGMRLPFGAYTGIEILDTLEVVAHERYEDLLKKAGVLNQAFVDYRTRAAIRLNMAGERVVVTENTETAAPPILASDPSFPGPQVSDETPTPVVTSFQDRAEQVSSAAAKTKRVIEPGSGVPQLRIPIVRTVPVKSDFSLADITENGSFRKLGEALAADPEGELKRILVGARVVTGSDGIKRTEVVRTEAADRIRSTPSLFALEDLRRDLTELVLSSPSVPSRRQERAALQPKLDAFFEGLGPRADEILSANLDRAGLRLIELVESELRRFMPKPTFEDVVSIENFKPVRVTDRTITSDRHGPFSRSAAYEGWEKSIYPVEWFDSGPERELANMVDRDEAIQAWVRLHLRELPIVWNSEGRQYNPDFVVVETNGSHAVVEVKMDLAMGAEDVQGKREAAKRWANHANADPIVDVEWSYLLVFESDIRIARGSWKALKKLGS